MTMTAFIKSGLERQLLMVDRDILTLQKGLNTHKLIEDSVHKIVNSIAYGDVIEQMEITEALYLEKINELERKKKKLSERLKKLK